MGQVERQGLACLWLRVSLSSSCARHHSPFSASTSPGSPCMKKEQLEDVEFPYRVSGQQCLMMGQRGQG